MLLYLLETHFDTANENDCSTDGFSPAQPKSLIWYQVGSLTLFVLGWEARKTFLELPSAVWALIHPTI